MGRHLKIPMIHESQGVFQETESYAYRAVHWSFLIMGRHLKIPMIHESQGVFQETESYAYRAVCRSFLIMGRPLTISAAYNLLDRFYNTERLYLSGSVLVKLVSAVTPRDESPRSARKLNASGAPITNQGVCNHALYHWGTPPPPHRLSVSANIK